MGERFCVRNSGAVAVVEGIGDHGCEYMTGGRAIILGSTGRNFAAGMSGGVAFVYDEDQSFAGKVNHEMVSLSGLDDSDAAFVRSQIEAHLEETASAVAQRLLSDWSSTVSRFVKVMPDDYRRVQEAAARAAAAGEPVIEAIMAASRG